MSIASTPLADAYCAGLAARASADTNAAGEPAAGRIERDAFASDSDRADLEQALQTACERAEKTWPGVGIARTEFVTYLATGAATLALGADGAPETVSEVYLAHACGRGDATALDHLERYYLARIPAAVSHMKLPAATVDEVTQQVRAKLLVPGPDGRAKIADYAGRGKLRGLVQLVAVRAAISLLRKHRREVHGGDDDLAAVPAPGDDPELGYLKARYRDQFRAAFAESVTDLSARERNLLRLHLLRGVTLAALAEMYSVHRATVTRWLAKARATLFASTRRRMRARLECDADEFDSVMRMIESRLDVSVQRLFATDAEADIPAPAAGPEEVGSGSQ